MAVLTQLLPTALPGGRYGSFTKAPPVYPIHNFMAKARTFNYTAKARMFNYQAKARTFNYMARTKNG